LQKVTVFILHIAVEFIRAYEKIVLQKL